MRDLLKIGLVANIFEWYEFIIYAYLADVIGQLFFNAHDPIIGIIKSFSVFAVGYFARSLGSLVFGIMGDREGAGVPLKIALMMGAVPTALIGVLPTYQVAGFLAPALLLLLRLIQGFAMGAELPTTGCYIFEATPSAHRGILCSVVLASAILGMLCGSATIFLLSLVFDHETILAWAWRLPFLLSIVLTVGINYLRRVIPNSLIKRKNRQIAFRVLKRQFLRTFLIVSYSTVFTYILLIWMPLYLIHFLHYSPRLAQLSNTLALIALILFQLASSTLFRFLNYQRMIQISIGMTILWIIPLWFGLQSKSFNVILSAQLLMSLLLGCMTGRLMEALAIQFPSFMRCRGMNLAYTLPAVFLGGTTPLINTWMIKKTGLLMFPAFYILFFSLLALPAAWRLRPVEAFRR